MTVQPVPHDTINCGVFSLIVTADDGDYANYATYDSTTGIIAFDFSTRTSQVID